jgi:hypothetical protein
VQPGRFPVWTICLAAVALLWLVGNGLPLRPAPRTHTLIDPEHERPAPYRRAVRSGHAQPDRVLRGARRASAARVEDLRGDSAAMPGALSPWASSTLFFGALAAVC